MAGRIFISYRRDDAAGDAGRLADHLYDYFGADRVFLDIDTIDPGTDFVRVLEASLGQTAALLVVIGPRWLSLHEGGARRIDNPNDFVRMEVESALGRGIPVVPVLVQGATLPTAAQLPEPLAPLATRQAFALDHAEFRTDAERLCRRLGRMLGEEVPAWRRAWTRWWPAAAVAAALAAALGVYYGAASSADDGALDQSVLEDAAERSPETVGVEAQPPSPAGALETAGGPAVPRAADRAPDAAARTAEAAERARGADALLAEAAVQRRRGQLPDALATLARARDLAPDTDAVRDAQEDAAMDWIRNVRVESGKSTFSEAIKPAVAVVDAALASATGPRRADLLAHSGWVTFLMWREGNRQLDPAEWYREALSVEPANPYANAMLAHWILFRGDDVPQAAKLFETALSTGRARGEVRALQWSAYTNSSGSEAEAERLRLADAMRREGQTLSLDRASALWSPYYLLLSRSREEDRQALLEALPPDDHIRTLGWAFDEYVASDTSRQATRRYWVAVLHARAGRTERAVADLQRLAGELAKSSGSLRNAVEASLEQLQR